MSTFQLEGLSPGIFHHKPAHKKVICHTACRFNDGDFLFDFSKVYGVVDETDDNISIGGAKGGYIVLSKVKTDPHYYGTWFRYSDEGYDPSLWTLFYDKTANKLRIAPGTLSNISRAEPHEGRPSIGFLHYLHATNEQLELKKTSFVKCVDCHKWFELSSVNIQWFAERGMGPPKRCDACRIQKRRRRL